MAANLVPLIGVLFFGWDTLLVLALFWSENLIIGAFNLMRMLILSMVNQRPSELFLCLFFTIHYGAFCAVHGMVLTDLLNFPEVKYQDYFAWAAPGVAMIFVEGAAVFLSFIEHFSPMIAFGLAALTLSHLVAFIEHFILRGEWHKLTINQLMMRPYRHILVMHIGLLGGALLLQKMGSPIWLLALIVLLKIAFDAHQHRRQHTEASTNITNF